EIKAALAEAVKQAEANDPKLLRAEISRLNAQLLRMKSAATPALNDEYTRGREEGFEAGRQAAKDLFMRAGHEISGINSAISKAAAAIEAGTTELGTLQLKLYAAADASSAAKPAQIIREKFTPAAPNLASRNAHQRGEAPTQAINGGQLSGPQQRILDELQRLEGMGISRPERAQLALWCEVSPTSGG